jgi:hypothetical protein
VVVAAVRGSDGPVTVDELADRVVDAERRRRAPGATTDGVRLANDGGEPPAWSDAHERLVVADLPALDDAGYVEFDADRGLVARPGELAVPSTAPVDPVVQAAPGQRYQLAVVVLGVAAAGVAVEDLVPATWEPAAVSAVAVLGLLAALALYRRR